MNASNRSETRYFNLHISGVGYFNRAREVPVQGRGRRAAPFLAVDIAVPGGDQQYTRLDCRVSGHDAQTVVQARMADIEARKQVLVAFNVGDLYADLFDYRSGPKTGQKGVSLKARLLRTDAVKLDGVPVHGDPAALANRPLTITGVAYLNRLRESGDGRLSVAFSALRGQADAVEYTQFVAEVPGDEARGILLRLKSQVEAKRKVLIGFKAEGLAAETFEYQKGPKAGQTGASLRTGLVGIAWVKVDGQTVYRAPRTDQGDRASLPKAA